MEAIMVCTVGVGTAADYYLDEQAEYYTGGKEPAGKWYAPAATFGLENGGRVDATTFRHLHGGADPDGVPLGRDNRSLKSERVGGYDLTFSAPKSVSVLWAVADMDTRAVIEAAQEKAAQAALDVLQEQASYARRGKGGATLEKVRFLAATFLHGEARPTEREDGSIASDPQLHTHSVIFNIAQREDGTWGALDGRHFFKWKMAAGALYRAELAHELQEKLGLGIERAEGGLFEIAGIPQSVRDHFSSRRGLIEDELRSRGLETKDAQALASAVTKASRRAKSAQDETAEDRHDRWTKEAEALGLSEREIAACMNGQGVAASEKDATDFAARLKEIPRKLTEHEAVFRMEALYQAIADMALDSGKAVHDIEHAVAGLLKEGDVVEVGRDELGLPVYSTKEMVQTERELVETAQRGSSVYCHRLSPCDVEAHLRVGNLTEEQRDAARFVTQGADIAVMEGSAGAGKTYALKTVAEAYHQKRYRVIGTSTAWRMANQLGDDLSIETKATDAWLADDRAGKPFLDHNTVLIVDEAGQLSSRQMLQILQAAEHARAKVILTGDQRQLQAIGAGPGLRLVAEQVGVVRIDTIVRQRQEWARRAVEDLSLGRADKAIAAFEEKKALRWCSNERDAVRTAVADWKAVKDRAPDKTAMVVARTNKQVAALNAEMREHLRETGQIRGKEHMVKAVDASGRSHDLPIAVGDQIMFRKRIDALGVINGTAGIVRSISPAKSGAMLSVAVCGRVARFATNEIADDAGRAPLAHAYAMTVYSAQGATVDSAFVVADHTMKRNEIYVAVSRARDECIVYVDQEGAEKAVRSRMALSDSSRAAIPEERLREHLSEAWSQVQAKSSTTDFSAEDRLGVKLFGGDLDPCPSRAVTRQQLPEMELSR
jgi:conjugative relaxase-like TrwC/TraI family protein